MDEEKELKSDHVSVSVQEGGATNTNNPSIQGNPGNSNNSNNSGNSPPPSIPTSRRDSEDSTSSFNRRFLNFTRPSLSFSQLSFFPKKNCSQCQQRATVECVDCKQRFCTNCDFQFHHKEGQPAHTRVALSRDVPSDSRRSMSDASNVNWIANQLISRLNALSGGLPSVTKKREVDTGPSIKADPMTSSQKSMSNYISTFCLIVITFAVMGAILIVLKFVLVPFLLSIFFFFLLAPIVDFLTQRKSFLRRKCPDCQDTLRDASKTAAYYLSCAADAKSKRYDCCRAVTDFFIRLKFPLFLAVLMTILIALGIIGLVGWICVDAATELVSNIDKYERRGQQLLDGFITWLNALGISITKDDIWVKIKSLPFESYLLTAVLEMLNVLVTTLLMLVFVFYLLLSRNTAEETEKRKSKYEMLKRDINNQIRRYIMVKTLVAFITGIFTFIILFAMRAPLSPIFGLLAFFFKFIPSIGAFVGTLLPLPFILLDPDRTVLDTLITLALLASVHVVVGELLEPMFLGDGMEIHPATILFSLFAWSSIWGIVGAFLAIPITGVIKIICKHIDHSIPQSLFRIMEGKIFSEDQAEKDPNHVADVPPDGHGSHDGSSDNSPSHSPKVRWANHAERPQRLHDEEDKDESAFDAEHKYEQKLSTDPKGQHEAVNVSPSRPGASHTLAREALAKRLNRIENMDALPPPVSPMHHTARSFSIASSPRLAAPALSPIFPLAPNTSPALVGSAGPGPHGEPMIELVSRDGR
eukprot:TRINITY_DN5556_c0_g10_i1.p1 TRINITY_DN5556_c0_g10~~TRINITY_DN5556_c0_g10_i1.p1  ORF type:complete len:755 (+),score=100.48 TRINITY_DN5556_c0_g10_i1:116-2380(+)